MCWESCRHISIEENARAQRQEEGRKKTERWATVIKLTGGSDLLWCPWWCKSTCHCWGCTCRRDHYICRLKKRHNTRTVTQLRVSKAIPHNYYLRSNDCNYFKCNNCCRIVKVLFYTEADSLIIIIIIDPCLQPVSQLTCLIHVLVYRLPDPTPQLEALIFPIIIDLMRKSQVSISACETSNRALLGQVRLFLQHSPLQVCLSWLTLDLKSPRSCPFQKLTLRGQALRNAVQHMGTNNRETLCCTEVTVSFSTERTEETEKDPAEIQELSSRSMSVHRS